MRLSPNKIEYLADKIVTMMQENGQIHLTSHVDTVWKTVADTIFANMREEQDIEDEVDKLLETYKSQIRTQEMDVGELRRKIKREVAKKRGFVL